MTTDDVLSSARTIAIVGLSTNADRPSYSVAARMQQAGYIIVPVNPTIEDWNGLKAYSNVSAIPESLHVDVVDVFRREEFLLGTITDALSRAEKPMCVWLQQGLRSDEGRRLCESQGVTYFDDRCIAVEYSLFRSRHPQTSGR